MRNIAVIGTGYVGLVTGACLARKGNRVVCIDIDQEKINRLKQGILPIYEAGLDEVVKAAQDANTLYFSSTLVDLPFSPDIFMIAAGTPSAVDGSADLSMIFSVARSIGEYLSHYAIVIDKSTVPVGTADRVKQTIQEVLHHRGIQIEFDVVSNPEFLREGMAVRDFMQPDRIIIGSDSSKALETIRSLYRSFVRDEDNIVLMSAKDAELCKYASNAFLATKISFMNEISNLCELLGADIHNVYHGLSKDSRISPAFLQAGCGYGGSCFPKDVKALIHMAHQHQFSSDILKAVEHRNHLQKRLLFQKLADTLGMPVEGKTIALWGLSFKPGTDDLRESPALTFLELALQAGLKIKAYDPVAMSAAKQQLPATWFEEGRLTLVTSAEEALHGAEALVLVTDWDEFKRFDSQKIAHRLSQRVVIDGRNVLDQQALENLGCRYIGFGAVSKIIPEICGV